MVSLIVDDITLLLLVAIIVVLLSSLYISRASQPVLHPLILTRQADSSKVRHHGESALFRNANSPPGFELAGRPRRGADNVGKMLQLGSATSAVTGTFKAGYAGAAANGKQSIYGQETSTEEMINLTKHFTAGLKSIQGGDGPANLMVYAEQNSQASSVALLSTSAAGAQHQLLVVPTSADAKPTTLPAEVRGAITAVFTTADRLEELGLRWSLVPQDVTVILPSQAELEEAQKHIGSNALRLVSFEDVCRRGESASAGTTEEVAAGLDPLYAYYWTGRSWVPVSHGNLTAGVTAHLGAFSADQIPTRADVILTATVEPRSLSPLDNPAGLALLLLAAYTGASLHAAQASGKLEDSIAEHHATMIYASPLAASELATSLSSLSSKAPLNAGLYAARGKLYALRQGALARDSVWDKLHFNGVRAKTGIDSVRSITIVGTTGSQLSTHAVDVLRAYTGSPVTHAYLPANARLPDDLAKEAIFTAPISTSHAGDLQAFDVGTETPYHVGPPSVSVEIKLKETREATQQGFTIEAVKASDAARVQSRWPADPAGEVYVRGKTVAVAAQSPEETWVTTRDIGSFRTNGTLTIVGGQASQEGVIQVDPLGVRHSKRASRSRSHQSGIARSAAKSIMLLGMVAAAAAAGGDPNATMISAARAGMMSAQRPSWVQGTAAAALLELDSAPAWNYFGRSDNGPVYRSANLNPSAGGLPIDVSNMAYHAIAAQDGSGRLCSRITGEERLSASSSLDASVCAMPVLLAAVNTGQVARNTPQSGYYVDAAQRQLAFVTERTNRTRDGAISQRNADLEVGHGDT